ncbi:MAG: C4-dicarboxylate ABC transporter [Nanoarchaeota archaeon]|nr:C4-dicarboxylate ABC transporter [Nanoarchaeota archaeon]
MEMILGVLSLAALAVAIVVGCIKPKINTGLLSITLAFAIGILLASLKSKDISSAFPSDLFLMLIGITLLFSIADRNGTLEKITKFLLSLVKGNPALFPLFFFFLTFLLSAIGPGNIAATALVAPIGMAIAFNAGINPLLMGIMICTGANAGAFSPVAPTGIIGMGLAEKIGIVDKNVPLMIFLATAFIQTLSAFAAYVIFKGYKTRDNAKLHDFLKSHKVERLTKEQMITLACILGLIFCTVVLKLPITLGAFVAVGLLSLLDIADTEESIKSLPWSAILLVTGVTVLIGLMEKTGGLDLATTLIAKYSSLGMINGVLAVVTGVISAYSSSSGVVMPAFIPLIPGLIAKLGGGDPVSMLISISVGSHMVDVSPLSTLGALVIASYHSKEGRALLYRNFLIWGLAMAAVGGILSYIFLDLL